MLYYLRALLFCILAVSPSAFAATEAEVHLVLRHMKAESLVKTAVFEMNAYELSKRQSASEEARMASRQAFAALVEKQLSWPTIEPLLLKSYAAALTSSEAAILAAFFQSEAGKPYVDGFLPAAVSMDIAWVQFVDGVADRLIDEPDLALERIEKLQPQEVIAARLIRTLRSPKEKAELAAQLKTGLASMNTLLRPKTKEKQALQRHAQKMNELGRVVSEEQITWRKARVLSQRLPAAQIEQILAELGDSALLTALHNLGRGEKGAQALLTQHLLSAPEVSEWLKKTLEGGK